MSKLLDGETVAVFGGGSLRGEVNNGLAAVLAYAESGARVLVVDRDATAVSDALEAVRQRVPGAVVDGHVTDVTSDPEVEGAIEACIRAFDDLTVVHNNVGVVTMGGPLEITSEQWARTFDVNVSGIFRTAKYALPHFRARRHGVFVNVSSTASLGYAGFNYPAYSSSKAALNQLTVQLALEYAGEGIRANAIAPGLIHTPLIYSQMSSAYSSVEDMIKERDALSPTGRMGTPADVGNLAVFLASAQASYINGVCIPVDGGLTARFGGP